ncbi:MAG: helix-turn-helix domain-containing protein [Mycobacteriaceae bacterium]|nr:helix-turn-helix domain-containing protein [Mycobacteriaceae bacterium]
MVDRSELAAFLRGRRTRMAPADVGLPGGTRRRTPGLRRQEVAELAGMSIDYYIRLEQARGPKPSRQVLSALARALMLSLDEREYLFRVAGENPPPAVGPRRELEPGIRNMLALTTDVPAYVVDAGYTVLAWNPLARHFIGDLESLPDADRNMVRWIFRKGAQSPGWGEDSLRFARSTVADLRAAYGRYPGNPQLSELVTELRASSTLFEEMWAAQEVEVRRATTKRFVHPEVGPLEFECQVLHISDSDQRMIVYVPEPGSATANAFRRLAVLEPSRIP